MDDLNKTKKLTTGEMDTQKKVCHKFTVQMYFPHCMQYIEIHLHPCVPHRPAPCLHWKQQNSKY